MKILFDPSSRRLLFDRASFTVEHDGDRDAWLRLIERALGTDMDVAEGQDHDRIFHATIKSWMDRALSQEPRL